MKDKLLRRFLQYAAIDTQSAEGQKDVPSTKKQFDLALVLKSQMEELGLKNVTLDDHCYLMGTLPANTGEKLPSIGFISHMDTSPDYSGRDVKPQIWENYDGGDIALPDGTVIRTSEFPEIKQYKGKTIITSDGSTLLGADDKAGIAEIMTAVEYLILHPEIKHGDIRIGFTPDEEIGRGPDFFDVAKFGADWAYTLDGSAEGELEYENFNAASARITFKGLSVHPGYAKDKMVNSILRGVEFASSLPEWERPEHTEGYEGFYHLHTMDATLEKTTLVYIIRDHDRAGFEHRKKTVESLIRFFKDKYGEDAIEGEIKDQYYNMRAEIEPVMHVIEIAEKAMLECGVTPKIKAIRGGTDGARLSFMGLPCPNIFTGGHNFHGRYEFAVVETMEKAVETIVGIVRLSSQHIPEK
ncbi:MAG: peptidase T [Flavobacteriales bacterium]|nr:MAG: peptidase T [Flavobacteriales bacterium]